MGPLKGSDWSESGTQILPLNKLKNGGDFGAKKHDFLGLEKRPF